MVSLWRLRERRVGSSVSKLGNRFPGCRLCLRPDLADYGLHHRPYLRMPYQSCGFGRIGQARKFPASELPAYIIAQVAGGIVASGVLYVIASGKAGFTLAGGFASNGYGEHSPGGYSLLACLVAEVVLTMFFLLIILGSTERTSAERLCSHRDWAKPHPDSPHFDSGDQHLGEPRP